jgi:hypothetical protein
MKQEPLAGQLLCQLSLTSRVVVEIILDTLLKCNLCDGHYSYL